MDDDSPQPGALQHGSLQPGSLQPGSLQPGSLQPGAVQREPARPDQTQWLDALDAAEWTAVARGARGIFTDLDDTLTEHGWLVPAAYAALVRAREGGMRMVVVTGRPLGWAEVLTSLFPIDAAVAENGAVAALPGGRRIYFESKAERRAGMVQRERARAQVALELPGVRPAGDQAQREIDLAFDIAETVRLPEADVLRLTAILTANGLSTTRSSIHLHGTFSVGDKAKMSARVGALLWGESAEEIASRYMFVGDSPNDAPAFAFFTRTIGVANILRYGDELRRLGCAPWAVTRAPAGHGFAELVSALLQARGEVAE